MSTMSEPAEKLVISLKDQFLECPVCFEHFNQTDRRPRILQTCLHAVCNECIDKLLEKEGRGQLTCPLCRHVTKVKGKASSLPADPVRSKLVDFLHMKQQKKIKCTDCPDGNDAEGRCDECQAYLCKECINAHKRIGICKDHHIIPIEEVLKVPIREFFCGHLCPKHPKQHIEFYCTTDNELCCVSCTVVDHKGHEFEKIQDAAAQRKTSIQESFQDVYKTKIGLLQRQKAIKADRNAVEQMKKESERNINKMIDDMKLQLDQRRNQLLSELQQESSAMISAIEKTTAAYDTTLAIIDSTDTYFTQTKENADDVEMLQMYPAIKRSVDVFQRYIYPHKININEGRNKFSPTQKIAFDRLVTELGAFGRQNVPSVIVQNIPESSDIRPETNWQPSTITTIFTDQRKLIQKATQSVPRTMIVTKQAGCTVAQGRTLTVKLYKGDMTTLTTDVIVREVDQKLSPWYAPSRYVADAAGPELTYQLERINQEKGTACYGSVFVTDAGRLPCKKMFNLVVHNHREGVLKCLCEAATRGLTSIALPCYVWLYGTQYKDLTAAVKSFDVSVTGGSLQEVHIVADGNSEMSKSEKQMKRMFPVGSEIEQKDIDVIRKHFHPSYGVMLSY